ncbi:E3 ubiquitin-protein ligase WAV3-like [Cornus florida]|uniref:E3 ubiquitin-protein ligase WAV3-like n=1 Tax=Cornus florida TaxID=4283 RepID=UPI00289FD204|nr:E3 ubiquitin-protein ligase WAV3-like [Cornus florida]
MGSGWRRAFCTTIPRDRRQQVQQHSCQNQTSLGYSLSGSDTNPSTPRFQSQPLTSTPIFRRPNTLLHTPSPNDTHNIIHPPKLQCKTTTTTPKSTMKSPSSSPRSPFSIFKNTLRLSRSNVCGICLRSVKRGQGMAIYTAECSHAFHFPCIAEHVTKQGNLTCPVCNSTWTDVPLLPVHVNNIQKQSQLKEDESHSHVKTKPFQVRTYDDDEPLLSPAAGGRLFPVPEEDENEEHENEEFRGFLVNPISSSSTDESVINGGGDSMNVEVKLVPEVAVVSVGRSHQTYAVVLKVKAPPPPPVAHNSNAAHSLEPSRRAPVDLVAVLDVGLSMKGEKMQMLKQAMRLVISSLGSADRLSIVAFSANPKRLSPLQRMTAKGQCTARRIIDRLSCSQGCSVGGALRKATKVLEDRRQKNPVATIMLLSADQDGRVSPNKMVKPRVIVKSEENKMYTKLSQTVFDLDPVISPKPRLSTRFAHMEIPVQAFACGGKSSHEPTENAFANCVGGLLSVVVQGLSIQLGLAFGSNSAEISAVYSCNGRPTVLCADSIRLGNLYAEEERELLVELKVPTSTIWGHVLSVRCCYRDPASREINGREKTLLVPQPQAVRSKMPEIERLRNLFVTTRAIAESRRLMEHNELSSAYQLLSSARALLLQSSLISSDDEYIGGLEAELKELHRRRQYQRQIEHRQVIRRCGGGKKETCFVNENGEPLTPVSAWRATERLAKVAKMREDLHGFENARF